MGEVFVPYAGGKPVAIDINGHRLVLLTTDAGALQDGLDLLGGDELRQYATFNNEEELKVQSAELAKDLSAGVVIVPSGVGVDDLLRNLEIELPWIQ